MANLKNKNYPQGKNRRNKKKVVRPKAPKGVPFRVIPLGGMREIGKNCTAIECQDEIMLIDCGFAFPEYEMYGIDVVIPDFTYLKENMEKIKGLVVTHGHEDHIGGIPYLLRDIQVPIYGAPLSIALIENKLQEFGLRAELNTIEPGKVFNLGSFKVEAIRTNHSIADSMAYSIKFPGGHVIHTGDFKVDYSPLDGKVIDLNRLSQMGDEGVDLLLCDSTNALRDGYTPSEAVVRKSIDEIFDNTDKRIIIATFSSNIHRIKYFMEASMKHKRRIAVTGRSMEKVMNIARELGYMRDLPEKIFIDIDQINHYKDSQLTIITTGSQGEPMSALTRMADGVHKTVKLKKGDVVVFSSSPIPGNEKVITNVVNKLYEKEVDVVLASSMDVHVSGHASREELKLIHTLLRPKLFLPAHGEYRHLVEHAKLAQSLGQSKENIFLMANGDALEIEGRQGKVIKEFTSGEDILVDGNGVGDICAAVLKDRKSLSEAGLFVVSVAIDVATGSLMARPEIRTRGFVYVEDNKELLDETEAIIYNTLGYCIDNGTTDEATLIKSIRKDLKTFIYEKTRRHPVILPMILYV